MGGKAGREVGERKDKVALRGWICPGRGGTWRELDSPGPSTALASKACQPTVPARASSCGAGSHTNLPNGRAAALLPPLQPCTRFSCGHSNSDPHREGNPAKRTSLAKVTSHHNTLRQYSPVSLSSLKGRTHGSFCALVTDRASRCLVLSAPEPHHSPWNVLPPVSWSMEKLACTALW